jgi:hypothetical protein
MPLRTRIINSIILGWSVASFLGGPILAYACFKHEELPFYVLGVIACLLTLVSLAILIQQTNFEVQDGQSRRQ